MRKVIGICGLAGSGKSTAAGILSARFGFRRTPLAGPLKDMLRILGLSDAEVDGDRKEIPTAKLGGKTPRWAMQTLGSEWGRQLISPDIWVEAWRNRAESMLKAGLAVVADDVRFVNEVAAIWSLGGCVIRLERPGLVVSGSAHVSERNAFPVDHTIANDGTVDSLVRQIVRIIDGT